MLKIYKNELGEKLYPVCNWEHNQHKLYNAHDRLICALYENPNDDKSEIIDGLERLERAMSIFDSHIIGGVVYATYKDGLIIKDYIWAYNARH